MRVTNKMIMNNAASNINSAKETVNTRNKQMTSQKKIDRPSDDPVIAVRSLRLSTTLSQVTQYYSKNIPDATSWLDVTETALINIANLVKDCKTIATKGATDTYNEEDRNTMITQLEALQKQVFAEGNADYANRTVFTGYRTNCNLTFLKDEKETQYNITQVFTIEKNMEEHRYYNGVNSVPTTEDELKKPFLDTTDTNYQALNDMTQTNYYRIRLNYDKIDGLSEEIKVKYPGNNSSGMVITYENETDWAASQGGKTVPDNTMILIKETGDLILANDLAATLKANDATLTVTYTKTGFKEGELRPEYYYDCVKTASSDPGDVKLPVTYTKFESNGDTIHFDIEYTVAANQTIVINTEASDIFNSDIQRDMTEMIDACKNSINAHKKLDEIDKLARETKFASDQDQEWLAEWKEAIQKECDFYDNNLRKLFDTEVGKMDTYYATIYLGITDLGCKKDSLNLTKTRVGDQRETVQDLQSYNDDLDLSQIIIDYTAAYTAYQASLTAAGKLGESTLLNYL
ncbi:flagellar hook-associated protein 3 [Pseudobutyrivibrio xylanivorans]|uniref:Flagellar hook-associated protein 3 n=1 Tax=Pseudobutyrivibrio xylanivorans TaxID=185007 RepID=A0A5P6VMX4_PSEXY|nr:flagellar hook-associated protein 3 [Pseudobutyrivibrio xylanivorans]QFJ54016.1 flagellar hook-associated protein 3 [Pseudobutyrivibrio xylanivorans]